MGIHLNLAVIMREWLTRYSVCGPVLTLGVQHTSFTWEEHGRYIGTQAAGRLPGEIVLASEMFDDWGLRPTRALDVSDFEGADIIFDLNSPELPNHLCGKFGLIINGGTLEHVFHVPNALTTLNTIVRPDGYILHIMPCNNWVNHGFYQFSPTFIFDYYGSLGYQVLEAATMRFDAVGSPDSWEMSPISADPVGMTGQRSLDNHTYLLCALIRRQGDMVACTPTQRYYSSPSKGLSHPVRWFTPFSLTCGRRQERPHRTISLRCFQRGEGLSWVVMVPEIIDFADRIGDASRSPGVVLRNDTMLGPPHAPHVDIVKWGRGAFSHWKDYIIMSTPDGSDPNDDGHDYRFVIPL